MTATDFPPGLLDYFAAREQERNEAVRRALSTLKPFERRLLVEAAVMGYVRGAMAGRSRATMGEPRDGDIPRDAAIVADVVLSCRSTDDRFPFLAEACEGRRRRITRARRWPGEH